MLVIEQVNDKEIKNTAMKLTRERVSEEKKTKDKLFNQRVKIEKKKTMKITIQQTNE